jgi:mannose-6-phosphate isomerase-like protein (cupin superfamily)
MSIRTLIPTYPSTPRPDDAEQVAATDRPVDVTVVVPTRNEAPNLRPLLDRTEAALDGVASWELLVVDDSDDDTPEVARALGEETGLVRLHHRPAGERTDGLSGAVLDGFAAARGAVIVVMDADLQHPPEVLPELVAPTLDGRADIVVGSRYCADAAHDAGTGLDGPWRRAVSRAARWPVFLVRPRLARVRDPLGGFFALRREVLHDVELAPTGFKVLLEVLARGRWAHVLEVPYRFADREAGTSKADLRQGLAFGRHLARLLRPAHGGRVVVASASAADTDPRPSIEVGERPWGGFTRLSHNVASTVKVIDVSPGRRLSLQRHQHRGELWLVLEGPIQVEVGDERRTVRTGETVWVPRGAVHRASNPGPTPVRFLEIAFGVFDEDDIERLEDDFART